MSQNIKKSNGNYWKLEAYILLMEAKIAYSGLGEHINMSMIMINTLSPAFHWPEV